MSMYVCQSVCLSVHTDEIHQSFVHVAYGPCLVFLWRRCDMLCTSGFLDDAMFSHNGSMALWRVMCIPIDGERFDTTDITTKCNFAQH